MRQVYVCLWVKAASGGSKSESGLGAGRVAVVVAVACAVVGMLGVVSSAARAEGCPNEALRQELHSGALLNCRAYEMVSPVFKDGAALEPLILGAISANGSHVIATSLGAFAGTGSDPLNGTEGAVYELSRTSSGWATSPLDPPASASPDLSFLTASSDLTSTLWALRGPSQAVNEAELYVREPEGQFVKVGPLVPPSQSSGPPVGTETLSDISLVHNVGASSDLSHVLIRLNPEPGEINLLWPGDSTLPGDPSLYEYVGTGLPRPVLVGVNAEGKLISNCGTELGGAEEDAGEKYNAVSSDGERVFFTARGGSECTTPTVNEVYARIKGAETIPISEPTFQQCSTCLTGAKAPAEFQGASEDGSKAFFTTAQELLPGQVGQNLYEYDVDNPAGEKIVLVSKGSSEPEVLGVARVSEDGSHVYFVAKGVLVGKNREGNSPTPGADNLYVFERDAVYPAGRLAFVATLSEADEEDWSPADYRPVQATPDGRFLVFASAETLTAFKEVDTSTVSQIFEYDAKEESLVRISIGKDGYNHNGNTEEDPAEINIPEYAGSDHPTASETGLAVTDEGSEVFFTSADALTPQAVEAAAMQARSVYEYHSIGQISDGEVDLISDGKDVTPEGVRLFGADASGNDVFFQTADQLVAEDTNTERDIYDARVDGGFPAPVAPVGCGGEGCLLGASAVPSVGLPGSVAAKGGGNLTPPPMVSPPAVEPKPKAKSLTRAQKLAGALRVCRKDVRHVKRQKCEKEARARYGPAQKKKKKAVHKK